MKKQKAADLLNAIQNAGINFNIVDILHAINYLEYEELQGFIV